VCADDECDIEESGDQGNAFDTKAFAVDPVSQFSYLQALGQVRKLGFQERAAVNVRQDISGVATSAWSKAKHASKQFSTG